MLGEHNFPAVSPTVIVSEAATKRKAMVIPGRQWSLRKLMFLAAADFQLPPFYLFHGTADEVRCARNGQRTHQTLRGHCYVCRSRQ